MGKKKRKKQKPTRETRFARYAAKFWQELAAVFAAEGIRIDHIGHKKAHEVAQAYLARRLYDFADHVTMNMVFTYAKDIPDLKEEE